MAESSASLECQLCAPETQAPACKGAGGFPAALAPRREASDTAGACRRVWKGRAPEQEPLVGRGEGWCEGWGWWLGQEAAGEQLASLPGFLWGLVQGAWAG